MMIAAQQTKDICKTAQLQGNIATSPSKRLVYGVVYSPEHVDTDHETMSADDIEKMAHDFVASGKIDQIDVHHNKQAGAGRVVESFIVGPNHPDYVQGSWVLGVRIESDEAWSDVQKGEINAFSWGGWATVVPRDVVLSHPVSAYGNVEIAKSEIEGIPDHTHPLEVEFQDDGRIKPTVTEMRHSHIHAVTSTTTTDAANGHAHRIIIEP